MSTKATALLFHLCFLCLLSTILTVAQNPSSSSSSTTSPASTISRFQEYLRINTAHPNPNYYEAADFILSQARALSLESQTIEFVKNKPLILLKWPGKDPNLPSVLLNSHTDVVPVEVDKWVYPPFGAEIDSHGNIYARGSQASTSINWVPSLSLSLSVKFLETKTLFLFFLFNTHRFLGLLPLKQPTFLPSVPQKIFLLLNPFFFPHTDWFF